MAGKHPCPYCGRLYTMTHGLHRARLIEDHACPVFRTEPPLPIVHTVTPDNGWECPRCGLNAPSRKVAICNECRRKAVTHV